MIQKINYLCKLIFIALSLSGSGAFAQDADFQTAREIYRRLTAGVLRQDSELAHEIQALVAQKKLYEAGLLATKQPGFLDSTVRWWSDDILTRNTNPNLGLNDSLAMLMGSVRDNMDARNLLTGNFAYGADPRMGLGRPLVGSNSLYDNLDSQGRDVGPSLFYLTPQWNLSEAREAAGILTTRWWASQNYSGGTNRRTIPALFESFLCLKIEGWRRPNLPTDRIRQDIDRFPQGDARVFQTECRTCHAPMDGLAGAFAKINFSDDKIIWSQTVMPKYLQHETVYPDGHVTTDNSWINFLTEDPQNVFGWSPIMQGQGIRELGSAFAETDLFARCMTKRVVKVVCRKDLDVADPIIRTMAQNFRANNYKLKDLFINAAIDPSCDR
jgi:hypothetical protein